MDFSIISHGLGGLTQWIQPYLYEVAMTMVATLLVVFGDIVNKKIKRLLSSYHFVIRTLVFVLICAFGYGALIVFSTPYLQGAINLVPGIYRGLSVVMIFLLLGYLAENRRYI